MRHFLFTVPFLTALTISITSAEEFSPENFISQYCLECHDEDVQKGDRRFDDLDRELSNLYTMETWQEILDQLNLGEMPPRKADQPSREETMQMVTWATRELKKAQASFHSEVAKPVLRRLNRDQYNRTVRTLLDLKPLLADPTESFPPDEKVEHFDTVGSALVMSDFLLNSYLEAAELLIEKATCKTAEAPPAKKWTFTAPFYRRTSRPDGLDVPDKYQHIRKNPSFEDGFLWLSKLEKGVPHDGWYELTFKAAGINRDYPYEEERIGVPKSEPLQIAVVAGNKEYGDLKSSNGSDRHLFTEDLPDTNPKTFRHRIWLDQGYQPRFTFPNGPNRTKPLRSYTVTKFPERFSEFLHYIKPGDNEFKSLNSKWFKGDRSKHSATLEKKGEKLDATQFYTNKNSSEGWMAWSRDYEGPRVRLFEVTLEGPFYDQWPTRSHEILYSSNEPAIENAPIILKRWAGRCFRRPATEEELEALLAVTESRLAAGDSELEAIQAALKAVLCSPGFLYLEKSDNAPYPDSDYELASKLSYFLWDDMPDFTLRKIAEKGGLSNPETYRSEVIRYLEDNRSRAFIESFTDSWLQLEKVGTQPPSHTAFPQYYTQGLEAAMLEETRLFFEHVLRENLPITQFVQSDFTYLNGNLARHYDVDHVTGHHFRKVKIYDRRRGGLLGHASVLTASANGIDTSPVIRGIYVLENILGTPPTPPPPDVEAIEPDIRGVSTIREQLLKHREVETCAECHRKIDPIGFALENYDPIGAWRIRYMQTGKKPLVDASGAFPDGTKFNDVIDLKHELIQREHQISHSLAEKLLIYSTGRTMTVTDRPHIDQIIKALEERGWGLRDLILLVTESPVFLESTGEG